MGDKLLRNASISILTAILVGLAGLAWSVVIDVTDLKAEFRIEKKISEKIYDEVKWIKRFLIKDRK